MTHSATESSPDLWARDYRALVWTAKSFADDMELEPFVDALPDVLGTYTGRRHLYSDHICGLVNDPDDHLCSRIQDLFESCHGGTLSPQAQKCRQICCYKAIWATSSLAIPTKTSKDSCWLGSLWFVKSDIYSYAISAGALMQWNTFCAMHCHITAGSGFFGAKQHGSPGNPIPDSASSADCIRGLIRSYEPPSGLGSKRQSFRVSH